MSDPAKDLIKKMLTYNADERISAAEAYKHPWFHNKEYNVLDPEKAQELVENMKRFYV